MLAFSVATNGDLAGSNGALSCRDDHGWCRGRNLCALPLQTTNDYSEIGRLNEDEIRMPAVAGVLFKWPLMSDKVVSEIIIRTAAGNVTSIITTVQ